MTASDPAVPDGLWCVIPVCRPGRSAVDFVRACRAVMPRVLVVADGFADADLAQAWAGTDITLLRYTEHHGKGHVLRAALDYVHAQGGRWMVTLDAEGGYVPSDLLRLAPLLEAEPDAVILGTRDLQAQHGPGGLRLSRAICNFWVLMETGLSLPDTTSGFRCYPVHWVLQLPLRTRHDQFETELLVRAAWAGLPVRSLPVSGGLSVPTAPASPVARRRQRARLTRLHTRLILRRIAPVPVPRLIQPPRQPGRFTNPRALWQLMLKSNASPAGLGVSAGLGVLLGALPLPGGHSVLILAVTLRLHLNPAMALISQNLCMPPFVPVLCIQLGHYLLHREWLSDITFQTWVTQVGARLLEWGLGALLVGPVLALVTGYLTYGILRALRGRRCPARPQPGP